MDYKIVLGVLSLIVGVIAYSNYFRQILTKKVVPHPFSWTIWGLMQSIAFTAQVVKNGGAGSWATGFTAAVCFCIAILAFFYSKKTSFSKEDWFFLALTIGSVLLWLITKQPNWSVILLSFTDALGMAFTLRKAYLDPFKESASVFGLSGIRSCLSILALQSYSLSTWLYPASLIFTNTFLTITILIRRRKLQRLPHVQQA